MYSFQTNGFKDISGSTVGGNKGCFGTDKVWSSAIKIGDCSKAIKETKCFSSQFPPDC